MHAKCALPVIKQQRILNMQHLWSLVSKVSVVCEQHASPSAVFCCAAGNSWQQVYMLSDNNWHTVTHGHCSSSCVWMQTVCRSKCQPITTLCVCVPSQRCCTENSGSFRPCMRCWHQCCVLYVTNMAFHGSFRWSVCALVGARPASKHLRELSAPSRSGRGSIALVDTATKTMYIKYATCIMSVRPCGCWATRPGNSSSRDPAAATRHTAPRACTAVQVIADRLNNAI